MNLDSLKNKTKSGLKWNFSSQFIGQIINFLVGILLIRWLLPEDFGHFTMVFVIVSFIASIKDLGFGAAIIQNRNESDSFYSTAFWIQLLLGIGLALTIMLFNDLFNQLYHSSNLEEIAFYLGIDLLIASIGSIHITILNKQLRFKALFKIQLISTIISSILGLSLAYFDHGVTALIVKLLSYTLLFNFLAIWISKWKPIFRINVSELKELLSFGLPVLGNRISSYLLRNTDDFLIGKVIGSNPLGLYNRAYAIMLLPISNLTNVFQTVLFAGWSKIQNKPSEIKDMFVSASSVIAFISFPLMIALTVYAEALVSLVFGSEWLGMVQTLRILSILGMFQSISALSGVIFMVFDKNSTLLKINIFSLLLTIPAVAYVIYSYGSIELTAMTYSFACIIILFPQYYEIFKLLNLTLAELIKPLLKVLILALISVLLPWLMIILIFSEMALVQLILATISSTLLYWFLSKTSKLKPYLQMMTYLKTKTSN